MDQENKKTRKIKNLEQYKLVILPTVSVHSRSVEIELAKALEKRLRTHARRIAKKYSGNKKFAKVFLKILKQEFNKTQL